MSCMPGNNRLQPDRTTQNVPTTPQLGIDFCGPFPSGEYLLVVTDEYSRFPEVEIIKSLQGKTVIPKLDKILATHGIPVEIKSDNGPPLMVRSSGIIQNTLGLTIVKLHPYGQKPMVKLKDS